MSMVEIVRNLNDHGRRLLRLESQERRQTFGRDVMGPVDYIHFQDTTIPTGYSWASAGGFTAPGVGQVEYGEKSDYLKAVNVGALAFLNKSVTTYLGKSISARVMLADAGAIGLRVDNGTSLSFSEINIYHAGGTNAAQVKVVIDNGSGIPTTIHTSNFDAGEMPRVITIITANNAGQHIDYFGFVNEAGGLLLITSAASAAWTVSRAGILLKRDAGSGTSYCDWLYTDMT